MSRAYLSGLGLVVAVLLGARIAVPGLPLRGLARTATGADMVVGLLGVLGLVFHCGAMFFPSVAGALPGTQAPIRQINAMGVASMTWYAVACCLVLVGLRRQVPIALGLLGLALVAVGATMYDGGALRVHLLAIFVSVTVLAGAVALLVQPGKHLREL